MKNPWNLLLGFAVIVPIVLLLWPFALWGDATSLMLRIVPSLAGQALFCRAGKNRFVQIIPLLLTGALAVWGFYLYFTSPHWSGASFLSHLIADYVSPLICCAIVYCAAAWAKRS